MGESLPLLSAVGPSAHPSREFPRARLADPDDDDLDSMLAYIRGQLALLMQALPANGPAHADADAPSRGMEDRSAEDLVVDLADPLQRLAWQPRFRRAFRAHFREMFDASASMAGIEKLCERLAPACTWSMLFLISTLGSRAAEPAEPAERRK